MSNYGTHTDLGFKMSDIDLKIEHDCFVEDTGWWIVVRSMDLSRRSAFWVEEEAAARGGPPWEYTDILVKARRVEYQTPNAEADRREGIRQMMYAIYFIKTDIPVKKEDQIIEIREKLYTKPGKLVHVSEYFDIQWVERKIDKGLAFYKCYVDLETPKGDQSLKYGLPINIRR